MKNVCESIALNDHSMRCDSRDRTKQSETVCAHPLILKKRCVRCARLMDDGYGLPFDYLYPSLRLSEANANRLREMRTEAMLRIKKLHLVLDLDQTLVHSVPVSELTPEEKHLVAEAEHNTRSYLDVSTKRDRGRRRGDLFLLEDDKVRMIVKLRPFACEFLREASKLFELTIYTMGTRWYALKIAKLLDPDRRYFGNRIISLEDCTVKGRKGLDVVLARESEVLIVDDARAVWRQGHDRNLCQVKPYFYFSDGSEKRRAIWRRTAANGSRLKINKKRSERSDKALLILLGFLEKIHRHRFHTKPGFGHWLSHWSAHLLMFVHGELYV